MKDKKKSLFHLILYLCIWVMFLTIPSAYAKYQGTWTIPLTLTIISDTAAPADELITGESAPGDIETDDVKTDDIETDDIETDATGTDDTCNQDDLSQDDSPTPEHDDSGETGDSLSEAPVETP